MPAGRTHETINLVSLGVLAAGYALGRGQGFAEQIDGVFPPSLRLVFVVSFLIGSFLVTPDLDLAENEVRAKRHWGLLGLLWVPYGLLFNHRGLSHTWIVGPATRLLYMAVLALLAGWVLAALGPFLGYTWRFEAQLSDNWRELGTGALAGYYLSQWLHLVADGVWPDHGVRGRRRGKRRSRR